MNGSGTGDRRAGAVRAVGPGAECREALVAFPAGKWSIFEEACLLAGIELSCEGSES